VKLSQSLEIEREKYKNDLNIQNNGNSVDFSKFVNQEKTKQYPKEK